MPYTRKGYGKWRKTTRRTPPAFAKKRKRSRSRRPSYRPSKPLKKAIRTELLKNTDAKLQQWQMCGVERNGAGQKLAGDDYNLSGPISPGDHFSFWNKIQGSPQTIFEGTSNVNRIGQDLVMTKAEMHFFMRANKTEPAISTGDMWGVLYIYTPRRHRKYSDWLGAKNDVNDNFLRRPNGLNQTQPFEGNFMDLHAITNSDEVILHKRYVFRIHTEIGTQSSWFKHLVFRFKGRKISYDPGEGTPSNFNPCFCMGFVNANNQLNPDVSTRINMTAWSKIYWRD